ncbi:MAG: glycosyltransferase family 39 protein [Candidatus Bathyarchaeia archaeon]
MFGLKIDFNPRRNGFDRAVLILLIVSFILRVAWLDQPKGSLIFDETYYVNAVKVILKLPHDEKVYANVPLGLDPNKEHPPLGKLIIAFSIWLIGDNEYGFRLPSVIFGTMAILVFYLLIKKVSKNDLIALLSTFLFSFETLTFVHSRIAIIDIFMLTFMLIGFYLYFDEKISLSAFALALCVLSKMIGLFALLAIALYDILIGFFLKEIDLSKVVSEFERFIIVFSISSLAILTALDRIWVGFYSPFEHINHMYSYTKALSREYLTGIESYPWQWLLNEVKIPYLTVQENVYVNNVLVKTRPAIAFVGAMNPLIIYLCIPSIAYMFYKSFYEKNSFSLFILSWFLSTYFPFILMSLLWQRVSYLFYFLSTVPSVCAAIAYTMIDQKPPRILLFLYLIAVVYFFIAMFPFKAILRQFIPEVLLL